MEELDLTYPQYLVMLVLWEDDGQSVSQIGSCLYLDSGTLTPLLKRLQQKGLVERRRCNEDERSVIVYLTEQGRSLMHQAQNVPQKVASCLKLSQEEVALLQKIGTFLNV